MHPILCMVSLYYLDDTYKEQTGDVFSSTHEKKSLLYHSITEWVSLAGQLGNLFKIKGF